VKPPLTADERATVRHHMRHHHRTLSVPELVALRIDLLAQARRELASAWHQSIAGADLLAEKSAAEAHGASWVASLVECELRRRQG
jgi:hypothetical protein